MLKTNSKKARENIVEYIRQDLDYIEERAAYDAPAVDIYTAPGLCAYIWDIFQAEKGPEIVRAYRGNTVKAFEAWAQGLALGGLFCYYYNRRAVDDLGAILEETESERERFTETEAENLLTRLIYAEINRQRGRA